MKRYKYFRTDAGDYGIYITSDGVTYAFTGELHAAETAAWNRVRYLNSL